VPKIHRLAMADRSAKGAKASRAGHREPAVSLKSDRVMIVNIHHSIFIRESQPVFRSAPVPCSGRIVWFAGKALSLCAVML
jgi:hypothetical protein